MRRGGKWFKPERRNPALDVESAGEACPITGFMPEKIPERAAAQLAFPGEVPLPERVAACREFHGSLTLTSRAIRSNCHWMRPMSSSPIRPSLGMVPL